jgi:hypothetical protein
VALGNADKKKGIAIFRNPLLVDVEI